MKLARKISLPRNDIQVPVGFYFDINQLRALTDRILERDRQLEIYARTNWFHTGCDLSKVKKIVGQGNFEGWCERELGYSKSKAEKMMRAAELLGPYLRSVTVTDLPPPTIAYALSGRSVPEEIRREFFPRIIAGEDVSREAKAAIKQHRNRGKNGAAEVSQDPLSDSVQVADAVDQDLEAEARAIKDQQQATACWNAMALILDRFDGDLSALTALVDRAGPNGVFAPAAEQILRDHEPVPAEATDENGHDVAKATEPTKGPIIEPFSRSTRI